MPTARVYLDPQRMAPANTAALELYDRTSLWVANAAGCAQSTVQRMTKADLLDHVVTSAGSYLYQASVVAQVRHLKSANIKRRGYGTMRKDAASRV